MEKVQLVIDSMVRIKITPELASCMDEFRLLFTHHNPEYWKRKAIGIWVSESMKYLKTYEEDFDGNWIAVSRGGINTVREFMDSKNIPYEIVDRTFTSPVTKYKLEKGCGFFGFQQRALDKLKEWKQGILIADTGSGKTRVMLKLVAEKQQTALIMVNTYAIMKAYQEECKVVFGKKYKCGVIGKGDFELKPITVAMIQTLYSCDEEKWGLINNYFGMLIVSECFSGHSQVYLGDGKSTKIKNIVENKTVDEVMSYNVEKGIYEKKKILSYMKHKTNKTMLTIWFKYLDKTIKLNCTEDHKIFTVNRGYVEAKDLNKDDVFRYLDCDMEELKTIVENFVYNHEIRFLKSHKANKPKYVYNIEVEDNHNYIVNGVLVRNCHHSPADKSFEMIGKFRSHYRFGESASKTRKDKKEFLLNDAISRKVYEIPQAEIVAEKRSMVPEVFFIPCNSFHYESITDRIDTTDWLNILDNLSSNKERNKLIISEIKKDVADGHIALVLAERKEQCYILLDMLNKLKIPTELMVSEVKVEDRERIMKDAQAKKIKVIVATRLLAGEGMDVSILSSLHLVTPSNNFEMTKQMSGRVRRVNINKPTIPIIKDYVDINCSFLRTLASKRDKYYKKLGFKVVE